MNAPPFAADVHVAPGPNAYAAGHAVPPPWPPINPQPDTPTLLDLGRGVDEGVIGWMRQFRQADYRGILPFRELGATLLLRHKAVRWIMLLGLLPMLLCSLISALHLGFTEVTWVLSGYFCLFWGICLFTLLRPERASWRRGLGYALFTAIIGVPLLLAAQKLPFIRQAYDAEGAAGACIKYAVVGVAEEVCKLLPILIFALRVRRLTSRRTALFLGVMSGLGFALAEGVAYTQSYFLTQLGAQFQVILGCRENARSMHELEAMLANCVPDLANLYATLLTVQLTRFIACPLLHAVWAGMAAWFVCHAVRRNKPVFPLAVAGIGLAAVLHGCYDLACGGSAILQALVVFVSVTLFMACVMKVQSRQQAEVSLDNPADLRA